jgi:hypothetical protein
MASIGRAPRPSISGSRVVWEDDLGPYPQPPLWDVILYDITSRTHQRIRRIEAPSRANRTSSIVSGRRVVGVEESLRPPIPIVAQIFVMDLPNAPPVLAPIGDQVITAGQVFALGLRASDPDDDRLAWRASNVPRGALFQPRTATFSWLPHPGQIGSYRNVRFEVSDGQDADFEAITVTVQAPRLMIAGMIRSSTGRRPVAGVVVRLIGAGVSRETVTGPDGRYRFDGLLSSGPYQVLPSPGALGRVVPQSRVLRKLMRNESAVDFTVFK